MPRRIKRYSMDEGVLAEVEKRTEEVISGELGVMGPPAGAATLSDNEALEWYDWADPAVTPDMLAGLDDEQATFLVHPRRFELMESVGADPEARVAAMDRYRRLSQERKAQQAPTQPTYQTVEPPVQTPMGMPQQQPRPTPGPLVAGAWQPARIGDAWETGGV